ncbi:hypothetical protein [Neobacillus sp. DY30]|nr:hypothetical protein [Neobacillus sp. DY30]WHY03325.1 hypothetical protein QNH29_14350 [Neobacillus sp. DY30]
MKFLRNPYSASQVEASLYQAPYEVIVKLTCPLVQESHEKVALMLV